MNKIPVYYDGWEWSFHKPDKCTEKEYIDKHLVDLNKNNCTDIDDLIVTCLDLQYYADELAAIGILL